MYCMSFAFEAVCDLGDLPGVFRVVHQVPSCQASFLVDLQDGGFRSSASVRSEAFSVATYLAITSATARWQVMARCGRRTTWAVVQL